MQFSPPLKLRDGLKNAPLQTDQSNVHPPTESQKGRRGTITRPADASSCSITNHVCGTSLVTAFASKPLVHPRYESQLSSYSYLAGISFGRQSPPPGSLIASRFLIIPQNSGERRSCEPSPVGTRLRNRRMHGEPALSIARFRPLGWLLESLHDPRLGCECYPIVQLRSGSSVGRAMD